MTEKIVAVSGAGTMGAGIAQVAAQADWNVRLFDSVEGAAEKGKGRIGAQLERRVTRGKMESAEGIVGPGKDVIGCCLKHFSNTPEN